MARVGVEPLRRRGEGQERDLLQVVEVDASVAIAPGEGPGESHVALDQLRRELLARRLTQVHHAEVAAAGVTAGTCRVCRRAGRMLGLAFQKGPRSHGALLSVSRRAAVGSSKLAENDVIGCGHAVAPEG